MIQRQYTQRTINKDALRLAEGPHLAGHVIQHSDRYRLLVIDGAIMHCTPTEYALLMRLLQQNERHLPFDLLEPCLYMRSPSGNPRSALIRHMRRLRPKLWPYGLDILSITSYGYMLHATPLKHTVQERNDGRSHKNHCTTAVIEHTRCGSVSGIGPQQGL